jgi:transposase
MVDPDCPSCRALFSLIQVQAVELEQLERLEARVAELEARLNQNSSNSSRPPSADPPGTPKRPSACGSSGRKPGGQPGHAGTTRPLKPVDAVQKVVPVVPTVCEHCRAALPEAASAQDPAPVRHQVLELPAVLVETTEYQLHARSCPHCQQRTWATLPEGVPRGVVGPRLHAACSLLTGSYRLSRRAAQELVRDLFGEEFSLGTLGSLEATTAAALLHPYQEVATAVAEAPRVNVDETRWREANHLAWLWLAATDTLALFRLDASRSRAAFEAILPPRTPHQSRTVTSDRYSAYCHLVGDEWQICWSHLRRDFQGWADAGGQAKPLGERAVSVTQELFHLWHQYRDSAISRLLLQERLEPVALRLRAVLEEARASGHWKVEGPARHLLKHWDSLWTFARQEGVEPTNNHAERALRRGVLWRKGSFGNQSEGGRQFVERMLTVITSLRLQNRNVLAYLEAALRAARSGAAQPSLLPDSA